MVFAFLSNLFSPKATPTLDSFYQLLWLCDDVERVKTLIKQVSVVDTDAPIHFVARLQESHITDQTSTILKNLLVSYPRPEHGVCQKVSTLMIVDSKIGVEIANAIGTEKSSYNKEFYHKIRTLLKMEQGEFRKFLSSLKNSVCETIPLPQKKLSYTLGLFNEPLPTTSGNPSTEIDILSVYKGNLYRNKHLRTPIEMPLEAKFVQKDFHLFAEAIGDEPIVIVCKTIGENVVPPKGYYLAFTDATESFGEQIIPYVKGVVEYNLLDVLKG